MGANRSPSMLLSPTAFSWMPFLLDTNVASQWRSVAISTVNSTDDDAEAEAFVQEKKRKEKKSGSW